MGGVTVSRWRPLYQQFWDMSDVSSTVTQAVGLLCDVCVMLAVIVWTKFPSKCVSILQSNVSPACPPLVWLMWPARYSQNLSFFFLFSSSRPETAQSLVSAAPAQVWAGPTCPVGQRNLPGQHRANTSAAHPELRGTVGEILPLGREAQILHSSELEWRMIRMINYQHFTKQF